jgi:thioredoxin-like negative regulator of GroEL
LAGIETKSDDLFRDATMRAYQKAQTVLPFCEKLMVSGDWNGANEKLVSTFPESNRSTAQTFLLGNLLYEIDRKRSYILHQTAAAAEPQNMAVVWEWAMEQHRAGEYANALESYQKFSTANPGDAACYALQADCLLRLNRIDEAAEAWRKSEAAPNGSLEQMETLVCAVKREAMPYQKRAGLLAKAIQKQDVKAASDLIALDCDFPRDWWNSGVYESYLSNDLAAIKTSLKLSQEDANYRAICGAAECATASQEEPNEVRAILKKYRLFADDPATIPTNGGLTAIVLNAVINSEAMDKATLRQKIGPLLLGQARRGKDLQMWNAALLVAEQPPNNLIKLEMEGWQATGDTRFAAGVLMIKAANGQLAGGDPDLIAAQKQFPESGLVQRVVYEMAKREKKITKQLLADAAKAEYKHFSSSVAFATVVNRPRSDYLRQYFAELESYKPKANTRAGQ